MILQRTIILFALSIIFIITNSILSSYLYVEKLNHISVLEEEQKLANEKFITAQILSEKLNKVYTLFERNLASKGDDLKNKEANMMFLKDLTDMIEKLERDRFS